MSFIIAAIDPQNKVVMAADTQMNSQNETKTYDDKCKIFTMSMKTAVAVAGTFVVGQSAAEMFKKRYLSAWDDEQATRVLCACAEQADREFFAFHRKHFGCVLMLARQEQEVPYIALVILEAGKVQAYRAPFEQNGYRFAFAHPTDWDFDNCLDLCRRSFQSANHIPTKDILTGLVRLVAERSRFVNEQIILWQPYRPQRDTSRPKTLNDRIDEILSRQDYLLR